jgi:DNA gyrase subunit A
MLISTGGTMIKMPVDGIRRMGRSTQGVIVMRLREGEQVSSLAPVVEAADDDAVVAALEPEGLNGASGELGLSDEPHDADGTDDEQPDA